MNGEERRGNYSTEMPQRSLKSATLPKPLLKANQYPIQNFDDSINN